MRALSRSALVVGVIMLGGCGDEETNDRRGYTKAPLETPSVLIKAERRTEMDRLGIPNRPRGEQLEITAPDTTAGD